MYRVSSLSGSLREETWNLYCDVWPMTVPWDELLGQNTVSPAAVVYRGCCGGSLRM